MRRDREAPVYALTCYLLTLTNFLLTWSMFQSLGLVRQALEDPIWTFLLWMAVLLVIVSALLTVLELVVFWGGNSTPNSRRSSALNRSTGLEEEERGR